MQGLLANRSAATTTALTTQSTLLVADGSCTKIRELLAEALAPVLWLESIKNPARLDNGACAALQAAD